MFDKLRTAFSSAAKSFSEKELKDKDIDEILFQLETSLLESDVAFEVIDSIKSDLKEKLIGSKVNKNEIENFVKNSLIQSISSLFNATGTVDIVQNIRAKKDSIEPYIILFVGINGTGKTTTLAKVANMLQKSKLSVVVAAADTFRAGAIEQLKEHTNRLNLKLIAQNYGSDPAAVCRDAVLYAKSHKIDCILIDTAGRMQTSKNLMDEISKINNVVKPDLKIFVGDSLTGNDTVNQAREFFNYVKFDGSILTKSDADAMGGAALSIVKVTATPILYLGTGQEYDDLTKFDKDDFLKTVFGAVEQTQEITEQQISQIDIPSKEEKEIQEKMEPEPEVNTIEQVLQTKKPEEKTSDDPFEGIETKDIDNYADWYDVPPPETDEQARKLAIKIREWISSGRPKPS